MSRLSRELCLPACLGIGIALYTYSAFLMPRGDERIETAEAAAPPPVKSEPQQLKPHQLKPQPVEPQPVKLAPLKPKLKPKPGQTAEVTGTLGPQAAPGPKPVASPKHAIVPDADPRAVAREELPRVPGIRVGSAAPRAVPLHSPDATRWSPAVGYAPIATSRPMSAERQMMPPRAKKYRVVRRPYRRHPNFRVVIGVGPRW